jgi:hypothetical protein
MAGGGKNIKEELVEQILPLPFENVILRLGWF